MTIKRILAGLFAALCIVCIYSFSTDDDVIAKVNRQLEKWTENHPIEKVHLHLDKPYYAAGEDIWFKAYVTIGSLHKLSDYSGLLNVELINEQDSIKQVLKLQLVDGTAFGDIALPDTLHEGNYRIRAYTRFMLNAGKNYIFDKAISIGNAINNKVFTKASFNYTDKKGADAINAVINYSDIKGIPYAGNSVDYTVMLNNAVLSKGNGETDSAGNLHIGITGNTPALLNSGSIVTRVNIAKGFVVTKTIPVKALANRADVQFFPEGGNILNGIPAKVAFKAIGTDGLGVDIKGTITDNTDKIVTEIKTSHLGMGVITYTPKAGNEYYAKVLFPDGSKRTMALPKAANEGYMLKVSESGADELRVTVATATGATEAFSLVGQSGGKVYFSAKGSPGNNVFTTIVSKDKFPTGIAQFTLFSSAGTPLNERLMFVQNPDDRLDIAVSTDKATYAARQKVTLTVESKDGEGSPAPGNLSIAVIDETRVPVNENDENNIMASLLLTADLKGYVEQPAYYFNNDTEKIRDDLDILMLTQGYRRFEWKNVLGDVPSANRFERETSFTISGRVTTLKGQPVAKGKVQLINYEHGLLKVDTLTDADGRFTFKDMIYIDSVRFLLSARTAKNSKDVMITMDTMRAPPAGQYKNAADFYAAAAGIVNTYADNNKALYYEQLKYGLGNHVRMLKEVRINDKFNYTKHSSNIRGPGDADQILTPKDIGLGCRTLPECLQGRIIGVYFSGGKPFSNRTSRPMAVVIDGIMQDNSPKSGSQLAMLNYNDVASIEVIRGGRAGVYGGGAGNGVIIVTTRRGDEPLALYDVTHTEHGVIRYQPKGVYVAREFYSPKYDAQTNQKLADLRTTVFWKPDLLTDADGKGIVEYFNAGSPGTYRVVIEGMDDNGNIGRRVLKYKVQ